MKLGIIATTLCLALPVFAQDLETVEKAFWTKNYAEAVSASRSLAEQASDKSAEARFYLALSLLETHKPDEAEQELNAAREAGLAEDKVSVVLGRIAMERRQFPEAKTRLDQAITANPENWTALYYRGLTNAATQDYAGAAADLQQSVTLRPENYLGHYYLGMAYNRTKRPDLMMKHFEQVVRLAPNSEEAQKAQSLLRSVR